MTIIKDSGIIERKVPCYWESVNIPISKLQQDKIKSFLISRNPEYLNGAKVAIKLMDDPDDCHFILADSSWLHIRLSGTESLIRIGAESYSLEQARQLIDLGKEMLNGIF